MLGLLLSMGADVNAVDGVKFTPLHCVTMREARPDIVKVLLDNGADVNAIDMVERSALFYAAQRQADPEVLGMLLVAGAAASRSSPDTRAACGTSWRTSRREGKSERVSCEA